MRERHIVPLSTQAVALLQQLRSIARKSRYVFPSLQSRDRPMSVNTVNGALRRLGYARDEMTAHGFRAMACTCLNELGWAGIRISSSCNWPMRSGTRSGPRTTGLSAWRIGGR